MKVTKEKVENSQAYLTIEMEPAEVEESLKGAYQRLVRRASIPGFRKGKAPRAILERYLGKESLLEDGLNHLIPEAYEKAVQQEKLEPVAQPQIEIDKTEPVIFKAVVPLRPTVTLEEYHKIQVNPESAEVKEDDIKSVLEGLRHQHATWEPVERPVDFGDMVTLDVDSTVEDKPFLNQNGVQYQVMRDLASPVPGFAEQLVGMKKGDVKEFKLKFPKDYAREGFADKEAAFKVKINEIKLEKLPELNDELAQQINPDFKTAEALREQVTKNLKLRAEEKAKFDFEEKVIDAVVNLARLEFPPVLLENEINHVIEDQARRMQLDSRGLEEYLKGINKTGAELREEVRPAALKRLTRSLALGKVAEMEKIEVNEAEISADIERMTQGAGEKDKEALRKVFDNPRSRESIKQLLLTRKTIEKLAEIAKGAGATQTGEKEETK